MNLDIHQWKPFLVGKLLTMRNGKGITQEEIADNEGEMAAVQSGEENNGVMGYIDLNYCKEMNYTYSKKPCLTVARSGSAGFVSFQTGGCVVGDSAKILLLPDDIASTERYIFLQSILSANRFKYAYGRKVTKDKYLNDWINLPIQRDTNGTPIIDRSHKYSNAGFIPDWQFMSDYVKSLHHKTPTTHNKPHCTPKLNINAWKTFVTKRLFSRLKNGKANQQMLDDGNECFYVGAKRDDNGVMLHCAKDESLITKGNCIVFICNGQGSVGFANYMDVDFIGTTDIVAGYSDQLNQYTGIFLATIYSLERPKYSFGRKWKIHLEKTEVSLPVKHNPDGSVFIDESHKYSDEGFVPDWQYMEDYIKALPFGDRI